MLFTKVISVYLYNDNTILTLGDFSLETSIAKIVLVSTFMSRCPFKKLIHYPLFFFYPLLQMFGFLKSISIVTYLLVMRNDGARYSFFLLFRFGNLCYF